MATGVCVGWNTKGYGFIRPDEGGADVFAHVSSLENVDELNQGARVSFDIVIDPHRNKPRADRVRVV